MIDFTAIRALTFDCYGTLIDWETGITEALLPLLQSHSARHPVNPSPHGLNAESLLKAYASAEATEEKRSFRSYRQVLARVSRTLAAYFGTSLDPGEDLLLAESIARWPAFPDTAAALDRLSKRFRLIILSNIDRDLFALSRPHLGPAPLELISAEDVRSYKPNPAHFEAALRLTNLQPPHICHVAQSLYHDIGTAKSLGFRTVWINRRGAKPLGGATPDSIATPDLRFNSLAELADAIGS